MDRIQPGLVKWRNTHAKPKGRIQEVDNCNLAVECAKKLGLVVVNIGGADLAAGSRTALLLGLAWQLMRLHLLEVLEGLKRRQQSQTPGAVFQETWGDGPSLGGGGPAVTERDVVQWANAVAAQAAARGLQAAPPAIRSCGDPALGDGVFLVSVVAGLAPEKRRSLGQVVDWSLVMVANPDAAKGGGSGDGEAKGGASKGEPSGGGGDGWKRANALYAISVARKMGACVFLQPEDVTEVKPKMLFSFMASIWVECLRQGLATAPVDQTPPAASSSPSTPASSNSSPCSPRAAASALAAPTSKAVPRTRLTRVWPPPSPSCDAASIPPKASPKARASPVRRWPPVSPSASSPVPPAFLPKPSPPQTPPRRGPSSVSSTAPASALDDEEEDENPFGTAAAALLKTPEKEKGGAGLASANGPGLEGGGGATARAARAARAARDQGADVGDSEWD
mmetsp:Transcript_42299/g.95671  ORF Transcript_42299/g.95671 Transcript_42299/m.95671 type:complete len:451 (+) Transcript_42299:229-1581(+)